MLRAGTPLHESVVKDGIGKLADKNFAGLGPEAARLRDWAQGRQGLSLNWRTREVSDSSGASLTVSGSLVSALSHMNQFFNILAPTLEHPPSFEELRAAALSKESVNSVQDLFDRMLDQTVDAGGIWLIPEIGGEATIDGAIEFHEIEDASRPLMREIAAILSHPDGTLSQLSRITALYQTNPFMADVDAGGALKNVVERLPGMLERGRPVAGLEKLLRMALQNTLANAAESWVLDPEQQFAAIAGQEWSGRYVGPWHTHPPLFRADHWDPVEGPSGPDMDNARASGQFLTVSFHPEGFDLYDLSALAGLAESDRSKVRKISYRSPAWREHFQRRHKAFAR